MSNFPPGVSGSEFQIAGPDFEEVDDLFCENCQRIQPMMVQGYGGEFWAICEACDEQFDLEDYRD